MSRAHALVLTAAAIAWAGVSARADDVPVRSSERVVLHTTMGDLALALYPKIAPHHVEQVLKLVRMGAYDSTSVYVAHAGYLIQISDVTNRLMPLTPQQSAAVHKLPAEFSAIKHRRGTVSMARWENDINSGESSFVILLNDSPQLDGRYTAFGQVEQGVDVLEAISLVPVDRDYHPKTRIEITRAEVVDSAEALAATSLAGPIQPPAQELPMKAIWSSGLLMASGLVTFLLSRVAPARVIGSTGLLTVLIGFFLFWLSIVPQMHQMPWLSGGAFLGLLGVFKLMAFFEYPSTK